jgi:hypothetical protein
MPGSVPYVGDASSNRLIHFASGATESRTKSWPRPQLWPVETTSLTGMRLSVTNPVPGDP